MTIFISAYCLFEKQFGSIPWFVDQNRYINNFYQIKHIFWNSLKLSADQVTYIICLLKADESAKIDSYL